MSTLDRNEASLRSQYYATRPISRDNLVPEDPALGLVAFSSPFDPEPSLTIDGGRVVELDGRAEADFDLLDEFIARHGIDVRVAEDAMALDTLEFARKVVDPGVPRREITRLVAGMTPAKIAATLALLTPVEILQAMQKMRVRRTPSIQAHVTNRVDHPLLIAADAASAVAHGFRELETTVPVLRDAPANALALLVGSQVAAAGALTQCSVEEALELELGMRGLTTYAETVSVYGTEQVFVDGDDTPWSKAFLASAYASRGIKVRFTSGAGSEALMGHAEGCSMLYLEARCLATIRAAGSQGVQNGGISTVALPLSLPAGAREILAENLVAAWLDLEVASGNDAIASHSPVRKTAKLMGQFLPGTDFVTSGYSVMPRYDNVFGGGNYDADDLDEWLTIQRDWQVDAGIEPLSEDDATRIRERAARAIQAVFAAFGFPPIDDEEVELAAVAYDSRDLPDRDRAADVAAADRVLNESISGLDVALALDRAGFADIAQAIVGLQRLRVSADYLQTSAIVGPDFEIESAVNEPNDYRGPGTGYRLDGERWDRLTRLPHALDPASLTAADGHGGPTLVERGEAAAGEQADEVVIALGPAYLGRLRETIGGLPHEAVLSAIADAVREAGARPRIVRIRRSADVAFIGHDGARLSGSGVSVGIQSKGTAVIHRADLQPLDNLELFGMAPLLTLDSYRAIGRNAAAYALGRQASPVPIEIDNFARAKLIVKTTLLHSAESEDVEPNAPALDLSLELRG